MSNSMRLNEFNIVRYGPLRYERPVKLGDFNLFWGMNEEGKTLTLDALLRFLFEKKVKGFANINRVDEFPEGYLVLEMDGNEVKLPEAGSLMKITGLGRDELADLFVIRNSDLSFANEGELYTTVTDRLTGLQTDRIARINEKLRGFAFATPAWAFSDEKPHKMKSRLQKAENLLRDIEELYTSLENINYDELVERKVSLVRNLETGVKKTEELETARLRERYERGREAFGRYREARDCLSDLERYSEEEERTWHRLEVERGSKISERDELLEKIREKEGRLAEKRRAAEESGMRFGIMEETKKRADEEITPRMRECENRAALLAGGRALAGLYSLFIVVSAVLCAAGTAGFALRPAAWFAVLFLLAGISTLVFAFLRLRLGAGESRLAREIEALSFLLQKHGMQGKTIGEIEHAVQTFYKNYRIAETEKQKLDSEFRFADESLENDRKRANRELQSGIEEIDDKINGIKRKSGAADSEEYARMLRRREELDNERQVNAARLNELFSLEGGTEDQTRWEVEIASLRTFENRSPNCIFDEKELNTARRENGEIEREIGELNGLIREWGNRLSRVAAQANEIVPDDEEKYLCGTTAELKAVEEGMRAFIEGAEEKMSVARTVSGIFEELGNEERRKMSLLFEGEKVSGPFQKITGGRYTSVGLDDDGNVQVMGRDGARLGAWQISAGTFDQLYLSIRIALGSELAGDEKTFFILDDPLVKADPERMRREFDMLVDVARSGRQILYFSAKGEIRKTAEKYADFITFIPLPGLGVV